MKLLKLYYANREKSVATEIFLKILLSLSPQSTLTYEQKCFDKEQDY